MKLSIKPIFRRIRARAGRPAPVKVTAPDATVPNSHSLGPSDDVGPAAEGPSIAASPPSDPPVGSSLGPVRAASSHSRQPSKESNFTLGNASEARGPESVFHNGHTRGLRVVVDPAEAVVDIVFIHGLKGDSFKTWSHPKGVFWPVDLMPVDLPNARVLTFGYDADVLRQRGRGIGTGTLLGHANSLVADISINRKGEVSSRGIIIIAHSLGGLVAEKAVCLSAQSASEDDQQLSKCLVGICFLGTPHRGSPMADLATILTRILKAAHQGVNKPILEVLRRDSELLTDTRKAFTSWLLKKRDMHEKVSVACFYEGEAIPGVGIVVDEHSACLDGYPGVLIPWNHREMQKFESRDQEGYSRVVGQTIKWVEQFRQAASKPARARKESTNEEYPSEQPTAAPELEVEPTTGRAGPEEYKQLIKLLDFPEASSLVTERNFSRWAGDTCHWLTRNQLYFDWFYYSRDIMWIIGNPGSGKTTLMRYVSEKSLEEDEESHQATFFFYSRGSELQRSPEGLLRSLLRQILEQSCQTRRFWGPVDEFLKRSKNVDDPRNWALADLFDLFERCVEVLLETTPLRIFIDALDECKGYADLERGEKDIRDLVKQIRRLVETHKQSKYRLIVCFSCRHVPNLTTEETYYQFVVERENGDDIGKYIDQELAGMDLEIDPTFLGKLKLSIFDRADGSFQWAKLVTSKIVDMLSTYRPHEEIMAAVLSLPPDLTRLYDEIISNLLEREDRNLSLRLFQWTCFSYGDLTVGALRAVLNMGSTSTQIVDDEEMIKRLPILSGGLAKVVRLASYGVEDGRSSDSDSESIASRDAVRVPPPRAPTPPPAAPLEAVPQVEVPSLNPFSSVWQKVSDLNTLPKRPTICLIHQSVQDYLIEHGFRLLDPSLDSEKSPATRAKEYLSRACLVACTMSMPFSSCQPVFDYLDRNPQLPTGMAVMTKSKIDDILNPRDLERVGMSRIIAKFGSLSTKSHTTEFLSWILAERARTKSRRLSANKNRRGARGLPRLNLDMWGSHSQKRGISIPRGWNTAWFLTDEEKSVLTQRIASYLVLKHLSDSFPFHLYAAMTWVDHLSDTNPAAEALDLEALIPTPSLLRLSKIRNPVQAAAKIGDPHIMGALLKHKGLPNDLLNMKDSAGDTALLMAVSAVDSTRYQDTVALLLQQSGIDVDARSKSGRTALLQAASAGHSDIVKLLLPKADIHARDLSDDTALTLSAPNTTADCVRTLIQSGSRLHDGDYAGLSTLSLTAYFGHEDSVRCLLEAGARPELKDFVGRPALFYALEGGHKTTVSQLLAHGVSFHDLSQEDLDDLVRLATENGKIGILQQILKAGGRMWPLAKPFVPPGMNVGTSKIVAPKDSRLRYLEGRTISYLESPLAIAIQNDQHTIVRILCDCGALLDTNGNLLRLEDIPTIVLGVTGESARKPLSSYIILDHALNHAAVQCIGVLVSAGLDINERTDGRNSLLHLAVRLSLPDRNPPPSIPRPYHWALGHFSPFRYNLTGVLRRLVEALLNCHIDTTMSNSAGETALMAAIRYHPLDSTEVDYLIQNPKVKVNTVTSQGTALLQAVGIGAERWVQLLLERPDIEPWLGSPGGITPLHWAAMRGNMIAIDKLLIHDRTLAGVQDENGRTPLIYAAYYIKPGAITALLDSDLHQHENTTINMADMSGRTALSYAAQVAVEHGATGTEALRGDASKAHKSAAIVTRICLHPLVQVNKRDNMGATPMDWCLESLSRRQSARSYGVPDDSEQTAESLPPFYRHEAIWNGKELKSRLEIMDCLRKCGGSLTSGGLWTRSSNAAFWDLERPFFSQKLADAIFSPVPHSRKHIPSLMPKITNEKGRA